MIENVRTLALEFFVDQKGMNDFNLDGWIDGEILTLKDDQTKQNATKSDEIREAAAQCLGVTCGYASEEEMTKIFKYV